MDFNIPTSSMLPPGHIKTVWEHLGNEAADLMQELPADHELIATVILFNGDAIQVEEFGYAGPNLLIVHGIKNGNKVTAYVHQSCLQVIFSIMPKDEKRPRQPFGFVSPDNDPAT